MRPSRIRSAHSPIRRRRALGESPARQPKGEPQMDSTVDRAGQLAGKQLTRVRWSLGIDGVLSIAFAVVLLVWPDISLYALTLLFGIFVAASGAVRLGAVIVSPIKHGRGWQVLSSLLSIAVGVMVLVWPDISAVALLYVIGAYAVALG